MSITREVVLDALSKIVDPGQGRDIVTADMAKAITLGDEGGVNFVIEVDPAMGPAAEPLRAAAQAAVEALPGVTKVNAILTAHSSEPGPSRASTPKG
ncbi:MAG: iron-sulfur cluster assembly protein, partial [Pseudomonadota bacterium]